MAQVARDLRQPDIDYHLDYQFRSWESVPEYTEWWSDMDVSQREAFQLEWVGITEAGLRQLQEWADQGVLTPGQRGRYEELMRQVAEHRPTLDALLKT